MEIKIKKNIFLRTFESNTELKENILEFIFNSKTDKILYKGDPYDINYKTLKKIIPNQITIANNTFDFSNVKSDIIKETYKEFVQKLQIKHCIFFKK